MTYVDQDTTDEFLEGPEPKYPKGTLLEQLDAEGFDTKDLGTLARQREDAGRALPDLPSVTDH